MLKKSLLALLLIAVLPLLLAVAVLVIPIVLLVKLYDFATLRWYCWRRGCWTYLVCSPRRRWHEFVENNLVPALPAGVGVAWTSGPAQAPKALRRIFWAGAGKGKPYLAHVRRFTIAVHPLHQLLHPLRQRGRRDEEVREILRALLNREMQRFLAPGQGA